MPAEQGRILADEFTGTAIISLEYPIALVLTAMMLWTTYASRCGNAPPRCACRSRRLVRRSAALVVDRRAARARLHPVDTIRVMRAADDALGIAWQRMAARSLSQAASHAWLDTLAPTR